MNKEKREPKRGEIDGVKVIPLRKIPDERGMVMHMLRCDAPHFQKFGEIYFATAYPGVVKAWHLHTTQGLNYAAIVGMIKFVLYDDRKDSPTRGTLQELFIGEHNYCLVQVPPLVTNGWKCISESAAIVANCATEPHSPNEMIRIDPETPDIPYSWERKNG